MVFFVLATIPCLEYYAEQAIGYLTKGRMAIYVFRMLYIIGIYLGSVAYANMVWDISGIFSALMTLPNIYMIYACMSDITYNRSNNIRENK